VSAFKPAPGVRLHVGHHPRALDALPERERPILELRFGFEGEPWTLEAIGNELELTRERVRQLEGQALSRLAALRELASLAA
jgi:RNA polymerase primary sigma factor